MKNSQIATAVALRDLKCFSLETINDRILLQKKIYLAQDLGLPLGYGYSWYIHGPYSTDLTSVAYQIIPEGVDSIEDKRFKAPYSGMVEKVNGLAEEIIKRDLKVGIVPWYELIASISYWQKHGYKDQTSVITKLKVTKPQFSEDLVKQACEVYKSFKNLSINS